MPHISIQAEEIFSIGSLPITNAVLLALVTAVVLFFFALVMRRKLAYVPGTVQGIFELVLEGLLGLMDGLLPSRKQSEKYLPLIATIFLFVLVSNWLGLLPGVGSIGIEREIDRHIVFTPLFRSPAADLNFTIALAVLSVFAINVLGVVAIGFAKHTKKFFNFGYPLMTFTGILEFISEFVKIISFSFRLFGNIFAGEVLLVIVGFLVPYILPLPFLFLEIFVGFIQAFIFAMLTLVFVAIAVTEHEAH